MRTYSVWDVDIGSRLGTFSSQEEALTFVRAMAATYPREKLQGLSFNWEDPEGQFGREVVGDALLDFANSDVSDQEGKPIRRGRLIAGGRRDARDRGSGRAEMSATTRPEKKSHAK